MARRQIGHFQGTQRLGPEQQTLKSAGTNGFPSNPDTQSIHPPCIPGKATSEETHLYVRRKGRINCHCCKIFLFFSLQPWHLGHRTGPWIPGCLSSMNYSFNILFLNHSHQSATIAHQILVMISLGKTARLSWYQKPHNFDKNCEKNQSGMLFAVCHQETISVDGVFAVWQWERGFFSLSQ